MAVSVSFAYSVGDAFTDTTLVGAAAKSVRSSLMPQMTSRIDVTAKTPFQAHSVSSQQVEEEICQWVGYHSGSQ